MDFAENVIVSEGKAEFELEATSFVTLINENYCNIKSLNLN